MPQRSKKIIWVFGAGASRGAEAYARVQKGGKILIPVQADFWETVLRFAPARDENFLASFLYRYFKGYSKTPSRKKLNERRKELNSIDVEEVFTFLSERIASPTCSDQLRKYFVVVNKKLNAIVSKTFSKFKSDKITKQIFKRFKVNLLRTKDSIITFNYDLILEDNLRNRKFYYVPKESGEKGIPIFKPHGSINFTLDPVDPRKINYHSRAVDEPFIIPPTHLKFVPLKNHEEHNYLDSNDDIAKIWRGMEAHLKQSKSIIFIGYSFPDADLYFSSVFRSVLSTRKTEIPIYIVNPDALRITSKIQERFGLNKSQIKQFFDFKSFCGLKRADLD